MSRAPIASGSPNSVWIKSCRRWSGMKKGEEAAEDAVMAAPPVETTARRVHASTIADAKRISATIVYCSLTAPPPNGRKWFVSFYFFLSVNSSLSPLSNVRTLFWFLLALLLNAFISPDEEALYKHAPSQGTITPL